MHGFASERRRKPPPAQGWGGFAESAAQELIGFFLHAHVEQGMVPAEPSAAAAHARIPTQVMEELEMEQQPGAPAGA